MDRKRYTTCLGFELSRDPQKFGVIWHDFTATLATLKEISTTGDIRTSRSAGEQKISLGAYLVVKFLDLRGDNNFRGAFR